MFYVYILQSQLDGSNYFGYTEDLQKRLQEHNSGTAKYNSSKKPFTLVWYCAFLDKTAAIKFEKYLKQGSGHAFANKHLVIKNNL